MTVRTSKSKTHAPKMTAHHFEFLADILRDEFEVGFNEAQMRSLASRFAKHLKATNPRFDADVFVDAVLNG